MAEDRFSKQSKAYAQFRPEYPPALFDFLAGLCPRRELAWDCATGNGQAARVLATRFREVIATDLSPGQIEHAHAPKNVHFQVARAEESVAPAGAVDLITVAQAIHWFDLEVFYAVARRSLSPGGVLAAWSYGFSSIDPAVDAILDPYGREYLAPYWSPKNSLVIGNYRDIPFPFSAIPAPKFALTVDWNLDQLLGYLDSWSATQKFKDERGRDPIDEILPALRRAWGDADQARRVTWNITLLLGRP